MNNYNHDLAEGDVEINFSIEMTVRSLKGYWFWQKPKDHTFSTKRWFNYY